MTYNTPDEAFKDFFDGMQIVAKKVSGHGDTVVHIYYDYRNENYSIGRAFCIGAVGWSISVDLSDADASGVMMLLLDKIDL